MEFNFDTVKDFDIHIAKSIPNYELLLNSIINLSDYFIAKGKRIYDAGCSTGNLLLHLHKKYPDIELIGLDNSWNLMPKHDKIDFQCVDLNLGFNFNNASLIFCIFTLQFLGRDKRQELLNDIHNGLCNGGALIIAEKVYCEDGIFQDMFTSSYYQYKGQSFTSKEIMEKEHDLRKLLRPNTSVENSHMYQTAGFSNVIQFYKFFNFEAHICIV